MSQTVTTSRGVTVTCLPIQSLLDKLNAQYKPPEPPSYEVKTATGAVERHAHDATTLETDEDRAAWQAYLQARADAQTAQSLALTRLVLLRGISVDMPTDEQWVKEQEWLGLQVPDDPFERKLHYIETEVIAGVADIEAIMLGVMRESGVPEELLAQMDATFRHQVGQFNGHEAGGPATPADGPGVVLQPAVRAGEGGRANGHDGKPVRRARSKR
jgi:hypothetical protein